MKKIYLFASMILLAVTVKSQSSQMCFAQVIANSSANLCYGDCKGTAICYATGIGPYTYNWTPGGATTPSISGLCAGAYTVSVTDGGNGTKCTGVATITTPAILTASGSSVGNTATAIVSGGSTPYTYSWNPTGQTGMTATGLTSGVYTCNVTDKNGCKTLTIVTVVSTGIQNIASAMGVNVYPNPATDVLTVEMTGGIAMDISVMNIIGEEVYVAKANNKSVIDIAAFPAGMYFITVRSGADTFIQKIVKN